MTGEDPVTDQSHARSKLFEIRVPVFENGATPAAAVHELARLEDESADLLAQAVGGMEQPSVFDIEGTLRRRAAVLVQLAEEYPEYAQASHRAVAHWQAAEDRADEEVFREASSS
jgi:hypothetical protein